MSVSRSTGAFVLPGFEVRVSVELVNSGLRSVDDGSGAPPASRDRLGEKVRPCINRSDASLRRKLGP